MIKCFNANSNRVCGEESGSGYERRFHCGGYWVESLERVRTITRMARRPTRLKTLDSGSLLE